MFIKIRLVSPSPYLIAIFFIVAMVRALKDYSLGNFQVYNIVYLTIVSIFFLRSPELII